MGGGNQSHRINVSMYQGFKDSWYQSINITRTLGDNRLRFYAFHRFYQRPLLSLVTPTRGVGGFGTLLLLPSHNRFLAERGRRRSYVKPWCDAFGAPLYCLPTICFWRRERNAFICFCGQALQIPPHPAAPKGGVAGLRCLVAWSQA